VTGEFFSGARSGPGRIRIGSHAFDGTEMTCLAVQQGESLFDESSHDRFPVDDILRIFYGLAYENFDLIPGIEIIKHKIPSIK
jgi:hypothetical protein